MLLLLPTEFWLVLAGIAISFSIWLGGNTLIRKNSIAKQALAKTSNIREFLLFVLNLVIVGSAISISIFALSVKEGGNTLTPSESSHLYQNAQYLMYIVWIFIGIALGACIIWVMQFIHFYQQALREKKDNEIRKIAHAIWEEEGCPNGLDVDHWIKAEERWKKQRKSDRG